MKHIRVAYQQPAIIHAAHPVPNSMSDTLCGVMLSGHETQTALKINCPACVRIITSCKSMPRYSYYKKHKKPVDKRNGACIKMVSLCSDKGTFTAIDPCPPQREFYLDENELSSKMLLVGKWEVPPKE